MLTGPALLVLGCAGAMGTGCGAGVEARRVDLSIPAPATAAAPDLGFPSPEPPTGAAGLDRDRWSGLHWGLEGLFAAAMVADWLQTLQTAEGRFVEANPLLGPHPPPLLTTGYFLAAGTAHAIVSRLLPRPWREAWQLSTIGVQVLNVGNNLRAGVRVSF